MTRIATYDGSLVDPLRLAPGDVTLSTIEHSLSLQVRWTGHTLRPVTILEHSLLVAWQVATTWPDGDVLTSPDAWRAVVAALLHDSAEAYLTDVPSPLKAVTTIGGRRYADLEREVLEAVASAFCLYYPGAQLYYADFESPVVRAADVAVTATEARDLVLRSRVWLTEKPIPSWCMSQIVPANPSYAREVWRESLRDLGESLRGARTSVWLDRLAAFGRSVSTGGAW